MASHISEANVGTFITAINAAFFDIPFGDSKFQIENFAINGQLTAERAYRAIGVRMTAVIRALKEAQFTRSRLLVDIDELAAAIADPNTPPFTLRRAVIDTDEKQFNIESLNKTIHDALAELNFLHEHFDRLPNFDRDEFERGEPVFHNEMINRQLRGIVGAVASAENTKRKNPALERRKDNGNPNPNSIR